MIKLLARCCIENSKSYTDQRVRTAYGMLCGIVGICLNALLMAFKFYVGAVSGSVAVTADAVNNLSDAGSSVISLAGFKLASKKPDEEHPFGHGRIEYVTGFIVSLMILLMGIELGRSSIAEIAAPTEVTFEPATALILTASICVKLYMALYNRSIGRLICSPAMLATMKDSFADCAATAAVLVSMLIAHFTGFYTDGWCGLAVAVFIFVSGIKAAKETLSPLIGAQPDSTLVTSIREIVAEYPDIIGMHDLVIHEYGPCRIMLSLHAEMSADGDIVSLHDTVDHLEQTLSSRLGCEAVVHIDPVTVKDGEENR